MSGLSSPRIVFGIHNISPYARDTGVPYGILKVVGSASLAMSAAVEQLYGGAQKFAWAAESKTVSSELSAKVKAYPGFLFSAFLGASATDNNAEASGTGSVLINIYGTSVFSATTGVSTATVKSGKEADVKFGNYMIKCTGAAAVDVYALSDVDFARGTDLTYVGDTLKITASPLTVTTGGAVEIPNTGIELTGGSGTIGMTTGDTAFFTSRPKNSGSTDVIIGAASTTFPAFGAVILAQKRATGEMFEIQAYNCIPTGFPVPMDEFAFSTTELKATCVYDSARDAVFKIRAVAPLTFV